jgi:hypothetical protein
MARQAVGEKRTRQVSRLSGVEIERILVRGGANHWAYFRTPDDRHGMVQMVPPYAVHWQDPDGVLYHWSSCEPIVRGIERVTGEREVDGEWHVK